MESDRDSGEDIMSGESSDETPRQRWPGPWSTAQEIRRNRSRFRARRAEERKEDAERPKVEWNPTVHRPPGSLHDIPSLQTLCIRLLCEYADCIEGLGPLMPQTRDELCQELCRQRKMLPEFFHLFATPEMINLKIPDCSEINGASFVKHLAACTDVESLSLGNCGYGFTNETAEKLSQVAFKHLRHLDLGGPYQLNDAGLGHCLQHAPELRTLKIQFGSALDGSFLTTLGKCCPRLYGLHLEACEGIDARYLTVVATKGRKQPKKRQRITSPAAASEPGAEKPSRAQLALERLLTESKELLEEKASGALSADTKYIAQLHELSLVEMPQVTDDVVISLLSHMKELRSLTISACPITDLSIAALAQIDLTHLRELRLEKLSGISGSALQQVLLKSPPLTTLSTRLCPDVAETQLLPGLKALPNGAASIGQGNLGLKHVVLQGRDITDASLLVLADHATSLESLDISWNRKVSDEGLGSLVDACTKLDTLRVWGCTQP